jgi:hypothetical protein
VFLVESKMALPIGMGGFAWTCRYRPSLMMHNLGHWSEEDCSPMLADGSAEIHVFFVHEVPLVKAAYRFGIGTSH